MKEKLMKNPVLRFTWLVLTVGVYAAMLAAVLMFFTGQGIFIYEAL